MNYENVIELIPALIVESESSYFINLSALDGKSDIYIEIGDTEAPLMFFNMNKDLFFNSRPDTHDLFIESLSRFNIQISSGIINDYSENLWFAQLELINLDTKETTYMDCKPSDLINLCLKLDLPIFIYLDIFEEKIKEQNSLTFRKDFTIDRLKELLDDLVLKEEYEKAGKIKKIIDEKEQLKKKGRL